MKDVNKIRDKDIDNIILLIDEKMNYFKNSLLDEKTSQEEKRIIIDNIGRVMKDLGIDLKNGSELFKFGIDKEETEKLLTEMAEEYNLKKSEVKEDNGELNWNLYQGKKHLYVSIAKENYYYIGGNSWNGTAFSYEELKNYIELWVENVFDAEQEAVLKHENKNN